MKTRSRIVGTLAGSAVALGTFVGSGLPAEASGATTGGTTTADIQTFKNQAYGGCMDDKGGKLWLRGCNGSKVQKWSVKRGGGVVWLQNYSTDDCLNDKPSGLGTRACTGGHAQNFRVKRWNDGTIRFQSSATGQCVDVDSDGDIGTRKCDKSKSQSWL